LADRKGLEKAATGGCGRGRRLVLQFRYVPRSCLVDEDGASEWGGVPVTCTVARLVWAWIVRRTWKEKVEVPGQGNSVTNWEESGG